MQLQFGQIHFNPDWKLCDTVHAKIFVNWNNTLPYFRQNDKSDEVSGKSVDDLDIDCGTFVPQNVEIGRFVKIANFFQAITEEKNHSW